MFIKLKIVFFISINVTCDFIYNHFLFKHIKKDIEQDLVIYNNHWLEDKDLRFITVLLRFLFLIGVLIFIFSFAPPMLKLFPFTFGGYNFNLGFVQFIFAVNLIGPKTLLVVHLLKLLCDVYIIIFCNTKTNFKMVALEGKLNYIFIFTCMYLTI